LATANDEAVGVRKRASQCCQPNGFPVNFGLFFCGFADFLKTCVLLVSGLFHFKVACILGLFFADCFIFKFCDNLFCFSLLQNAIWACFCINLFILGLFFGFAYLFLF